MRQDLNNTTITMPTQIGDWRKFTERSNVIGYHNRDYVLDVLMINPNSYVVKLNKGGRGIKNLTVTPNQTSALTTAKVYMGNYPQGE